MDLRRQIENHVLIIIAGAFVTGVSMTWIVANEVLVKPRDYDLQRQRELITELTSALGHTPDSNATTNGGDAPPTAGSLQPLTLEILPSIEQATLETTLRRLRPSKKLRDLTPLESGNPISQTAAGTHFFLRAEDCEIRDADLNPLWNWTRVNRINTYKNFYFEIFLQEEKQAAFVVFVSDDAVAEISKLDGKTQKRVTVAPTQWNQMTNLVLIPDERVAEATDREVSIRQFETIHLLDITIQ